MNGRESDGTGRLKGRRTDINIRINRQTGTPGHGGVGGGVRGDYWELFIRTLKLLMHGDMTLTLTHLSPRVILLIHI